MKCPVCKNEPATYHAIFGILPGINCQQRRDGNSIPEQIAEMAGEQVKEERKTFASSVVQPFRSDGTLSKEYLEAHGTKGIKVTQEQIRKAKYIWDKSPNFDIKKTR